MHRPSIWLSITLFLFFFTITATAKPLNFQQFFPRFNNAILTRLNGECQQVYNYHLNDFSPSCEAQGRQKPSCRASRVIDCLNEALLESWKVNMAAAAVLLGLLPTTLAILGSNSRETSLLALRRPFLALLLAIGAPGVSPLRSTQHADHAHILAEEEDRISMPHLSTFGAALAACAQYAFACVSALNVAHVTWQLCILTVNSFSPEAVFFPALWVATAVLVNMGGYLSTLLRTRVQTTREPYEKPSSMALLLPGSLGLRCCAASYSILSWLG